MSYAQKTTVAVDKSKAEIERILSRYGATGFGYMVEGSKAMVLFAAHGRRIRFILPMPAQQDVSRTPTGRPRRSAAIDQALDDETRRRWRALALTIKAKLEAVETGITEFEEEFLAHIVLPNNRTVAEMVIPEIASAYGGRQIAKLLPDFTGVRP